jgi:Zn-dependent peptidase ImmA (M78 family)
MPESDLLAQVARVDSLSQLIHAKARWKVSLAALTYRLHKIGVISDWRYRDFCIEISSKGYIREEPHGIQREQSIVWQKVLKTLWSEATTLEKVANELALPEAELSALLFGVLASETRSAVPPKIELSLVDNDIST